NSNAARANALVRKRGGGNLCGALIFLPDAHLKWKMEPLAQAALFECRHDEYRAPRARQDQPKQAFAKPPTNAREVVKRSAGRKEQRVIFENRVRHQTLRVLDALAKFVHPNRVRPPLKRLQCRKGRRGRII